MPCRLHSPQSSRKKTQLSYLTGANATHYDTLPLLWVPASFGTEVFNYLPRAANDVPDSHLSSTVNMYLIDRYYFNGSGQPTFDLGTNGLLVAKKAADIAAPCDSNTGP